MQLLNEFQFVSHIPNNKHNNNKSAKSYLKHCL